MSGSRACPIQIMQPPYQPLPLTSLLPSPAHLSGPLSDEAMLTSCQEACTACADATSSYSKTTDTNYFRWSRRISFVLESPRLRPTHLSGPLSEEAMVTPCFEACTACADATSSYSTKQFTLRGP